MAFIVNSCRVSFSDAFFGTTDGGGGGGVDLTIVWGLRSWHNVGWDGLLIDRLLIEMKSVFLHDQ